MGSEGVPRMSVFMFDDTVSRGLRANHDIDEENEFWKTRSFSYFTFDTWTRRLVFS